MGAAGANVLLWKVARLRVIIFFFGGSSCYGGSSVWKKVVSECSVGLLSPGPPSFYLLLDVFFNVSGITSVLYWN